MKYLLGNKETYRVDTLSEVEELRNAVEGNKWYDVNSFTYAHKFIKKTEEEYYLVTVGKKITDEKEPDRHVRIAYEVDN